MAIPVSATVGLQLRGPGLAKQYSAGEGDAQKATELLQQRFPARAGDGAQIVLAGPDLTRPQVREAVERGVGAVRSVAHVAGVGDPYGGETGRVADAGQVSRDRTVGYVTVQFDRRAADLPKATAEQVRSAFEPAVSRAGLRVEYVGQMFNPSGPPPYAELAGAAVAVVVLLALGSFLALSVPLLTALVAVGTAVTFVLFYLSRQVTVPDFAAQVVSFLAIGVCVDYALLVVHRYRAELGRGLAADAAVEAAMSTAGRAAVFSGLTVMGSLAGMLVVGIGFITGLALAAILAVGVSVVATLTLVPALISVFGRRARPLPPEKAASGAWRRLSLRVQRRPLAASVMVVAVLGALAAPVLSIRLGQVDASNESTASAGRRAYDLLGKGFGPGATGPLLLVTDLTRGSAHLSDVQTLAHEIAAEPDVAQVAPVQVDRAAAPRTASFRVTSAFGQQDERTTRLVRHLRSGPLARLTAATRTPAYVGGQTARGIDLASALQQRLPWLVGGVITASMLMLLLLFRSIAIPLKAAVMNVLSVGAAFGLVVAVFQFGWGADLIGVGRPGPVLAFAPVLIFSIAFGVSMDYEVFLLERMREHYRACGDNTEAVTVGMASTGRVVTSCALVMIAVFAALISGVALPAKIIGLGLAAAVAIDATLVRMILVPAVMQMLGNANWWPAGRPQVHHDDAHRAQPVPR
ncbi:MMPL family transporter [Streptomyces sp. NPDC058459]|uniref:MMPL family transporter n=1 Tax=Streptomyces sp. NPDC058459 TaxID=3346508 RepID=UPI00364D7CB4